MELIFKHLLQTVKTGRQGALATIVRRKGSVPRKEGAHLFLTETGQVFGTIGGGGLEAEIIGIAKRVSGSPGGYLQPFALVEGDDPSDMVCGGNVSILIEPLFPEDEVVYNLISSTVEARSPCCYVRLFHRQLGGETALEIGPKGIVWADANNKFSAPVEKNLEKRLVAWAQVILKEGNQTIHILNPEMLGLRPSAKWNMAVLEVLQVFPRLVIFGGGHLSQALCRMATLCNFQVEIIDDREEFANRKRFPEATRAFHLPGYLHISELVSLNMHTFVVIATRGHRFDEEVLRQALSHKVAYIGMVGSRSKNAIVFDRLEKQGISTSAFNQVHAPIGLPIHSDTPEEIAVSILAEMIKVKAE